MFSRVRIAIRFFFMGLAVGMLLAPRSGQETRRMLRERADRLLNDLLDAATLGTTSPFARRRGHWLAHRRRCQRPTRSGHHAPRSDRPSFIDR